MFFVASFHKGASLFASTFPGARANGVISAAVLCLSARLLSRSVVTLAWFSMRGAAMVFWLHVHWEIVEQAENLHESAQYPHELHELCHPLDMYCQFNHALVHLLRLAIEISAQPLALFSHASK